MARVTSQSKRLHIRRVYDPPGADDGIRVLVDRVWPRGLSKQRASIDLWLKDIAPSTPLRKRFGHDPERWPAFVADYRAELDKNDICVARLVAMMKGAVVTLLFGARDIEHNQAVALRDYLTTRKTPARAAKVLGSGLKRKRRT